MTPDERALQELLESIANGEPTDWARAEGAADAKQREHVRTLHDLSRVADFHRSLQHGADDGGLFEGGRWGELLLLEKAGEGADGSVYRAWDPSLRREVALKLARTGAPVGTMLDEARALARVRDPHVVTVHGAAEHDGRAGFWMEYLRGPSLEVLLGMGALAPARVAQLGAEMARALAAVHGAGALHRDVKPANVIATDDGHFVLVDFGLGEHAGSAAGLARPFSGTPAYMSPARLLGAVACASDDLYALGVTLRRALTGRAPFAASSLEALRAEAAAGPAVALAADAPGAPPALVAAIERLMAAAPAARFASATDARAALEACVADAGAGAVGARDAGAAARDATVAGSAAGTMGGARAVTASRRGQLALPLAIGAVVAVAALLAWPRLRPRTTEVPTPAPSLAAVAPVAYDVSATLMRGDAGSTTALVDGDAVKPGDRLLLEFRASQPAYVYVLNADDKGESYLLFPQPLFDQKNPIAAGATVRMPGTRAGKESGWVVTSRGGHEHFLVVASPQPVPELEAELATLPAVSPDRPISYARVGAAPLDKLRGVGGVADLPVSAGSASRGTEVFGKFRALAGQEQGVRGVWVRQVTLRN